MNGTYRIKRVHNGILAFAEVSVRLEPAAADEILVEPSATSFEPFRGALERGVSDALSENTNRKAFSVHVLALKDIPVDTLEDAVECAAAGATWRAMGHAEDQIVLTHSDERWQVSLNNPDQG